MALGLGKAGARLLLNGRDRETLEEAVDAFRKENIDCRSYAFDVADRNAVREAVQKIFAETGEVHILVNNAGVNHRKSLEDFDDEEYRSIMEVNVDSIYFLSRLLARPMIERRAGKIINITSVAAEISRAKIAPYAASKGAVKLLTKGMAVDWGRYNIQINAIGPGFNKTDMNEALYTDEEFNSWVESRVPARRWGEPEELAGAAVFLASAASNYVNGHTLYVDGGLLSQM
jgi:gluconate 5-dehydrogenase